DGRLGYATTNSYYNTWGMRNIAILQTPKDHGPYLFVPPQITNPYYPNRIINIFRLDYTGFDELADWFRGHAQPDQKMVTALSSALVRLFAPELKGRIVHTSQIRADSFKDFLWQCRQRHIEYIVWDSLMSNQADKGNLYQEWGLENLEPLRQAIRHADLTDRKAPVRAGECELVHHILHENKILIAVFRLPPEPSPPSPQGNAP
ncbi:MAG: hypothetical protein JW810_01280, partial [Sedimentisphaerales bacterium]|nr:hypothetical protein [Sedimentisphaerales bacterium]